jgi:hypothetical protein
MRAGGGRTDAADLSWIRSSMAHDDESSLGPAPCERAPAAMVK